MQFNSIGFFVFFGSLTLCYFALPYKFRNLFLLASSYFFYMFWNAGYALVLLFSTAASYVFSLLIEKAPSKKKKRLLLISSLFFNIGLLFVFKYLAFFTASLRAILKFCAVPVEPPSLDILLPVGISFFTFRAMSCLIDIYRGKMEAERNFCVFALYVSFFPSLLAGPIDRAVSLIPQFHARHSIDMQRICAGARIVLWGLFKKVVIADRLAIYADSIFNNVPHHTGLSYIVAAYFYTFQIYCDFSGYTDMAIGCAKILGFDLMQNFNLPYFSTTITDFWRRWHISLSTWFRDYLYISMGGNRKGAGRIYVNLLITMAVCGLWHGASWTFIIWGVLHGCCLCLSRLTLNIRDGVYQRLRIPAGLVNTIRTVLTFHLVAFLWIFFRANSVHDAVYIVTHLFSGWPNLFIDPLSLFHGFLGIVVLMCVELLQRLNPQHASPDQWPLPLRWAAYYALALSIVLFGVDGGSQFIYFQF